ncbi:DNA methyltransferase [Massilia sp. CCM 8734]|uniref:DNA methyltransferase n=1 Tax=Massilia sp. CCM 8734 TaxID=2609283 RepID=UPI0014229E54|nr:DNA methyltransferase [Massilia sp. CCM 8734]NIA01003.1 DNA methylase [Massilia sp. CCM 8734]
MYSYANSFSIVPTFTQQPIIGTSPVSFGETNADKSSPQENRGYKVLQGDCIEILANFTEKSFNFVLTDPPYIAGYRDRSGRNVANDDNDRWLLPAFKQIYRVLADNSFCVSFYGWSQTDRFFAAWKAAGFRIVGHITFPKRYTSTIRMLRYQHESAYLLAKGQPAEPENVIGDVIDWGAYTGNKLHPTQKPVSILLPL